MSGHTPGPWALVNDHCVVGPHSDPANVDEHPTAGIAMCHFARRSDAENYANAALIVVAPELLDFVALVAKGLARGSISAAPVGLIDLDATKIDMRPLSAIAQDLYRRATGRRL